MVQAPRPSPPRAHLDSVERAWATSSEALVLCALTWALEWAGKVAHMCDSGFLPDLRAVQFFVPSLPAFPTPAEILHEVESVWAGAHTFPFSVTFQVYDSKYWYRDSLLKPLFSLARELCDINPRLSTRTSRLTSALFDRSDFAWCIDHLDTVHPAGWRGSLARMHRTHLHAPEPPFQAPTSTTTTAAFGVVSSRTGARPSRIRRCPWRPGRARGRRGIGGPRR